MPALQHTFAQFCADNAEWLDDFALFIALREVRAMRRGCSGMRRCASAIPRACRCAQHTCAAHRCASIRAIFFFEQWQALRTEAQRLGIALFGDLPISSRTTAPTCGPTGFIRARCGRKSAHDRGRAPDYFSETGQRGAIRITIGCACRPMISPGGARACARNCSCSICCASIISRLRSVLGNPGI